MVKFSKIKDWLTLSAMFVAEMMYFLMLFFMLLFMLFSFYSQ